MRVLLVGAGGRESAIAETLSKDVELYVVAKHVNPGIKGIAKEYGIAKETDVQKVLDFALKWNVDMTLIGPEAPLEKGIVNVLEENGIPTVGPSKEAAQLETNKAFARALMEKYKIPGR
ncbi:MAG TPA: phosphoribosylamine--glycine ligase, partial [Thermococcus litoralis]|nr:phosphoribosylamine--glycine ligase [Thermococcus litoralis]